MEIKQLQEIILEAMRIHEESWVPGSHPHYAVGKIQAAKAACKAVGKVEWMYTVYLLITSAWGDSENLLAVPHESIQDLE